jgi:hypothetical protein
MSIDHVLAQWSTYQLMIKAVYTGINDPQTLEDAIANVGPFPTADPSKWNIWMNALDGLNILADAVEVTDAALQVEVDFIAATNSIAAATKLSAPSQLEVANLISQLNIVNKAIQSDQRFHAALQIGKALANSISSNLKKK